MANLLDLDDYVKPAGAGLGAKPVTTAPTKFEFGAGPEKWLRPAAKKLASVAVVGAPLAAGVEQLTRGGYELYKDGPTLSSVARTGAGVAALLSPHGRAVATGMSLADWIPTKWYDKTLRGMGLIEDKDPLSPAFRSQVDSAGGTADAYMKSRALGAHSVMRSSEPSTLPLSPESPPQEAPVALPTNTVVPARGTGFIRNNTTGDTTYLNSSTTPPAVAQPYQARSGIAGFIGNMLGLKKIVGDNKQATERSKLLIDSLKANASIRKDTAEAANAEQRQTEAARARAAGASPAEVSAILAGRSSGDRFSFIPDITGNNVIVGNRGTGAVTARKPRSEVTEAHIQADMKNMKLTREQVLAEYRRRGLIADGGR
jgi:hypothetical protein